MLNPSQILSALIELHELEARLDGSKPRGAPALERERGKVRDRIPAAVLSHHDRMRLRGKRSIAPIRHGVCFGCFISVPIGDRAHIESGRDLAMCQTCGRFLYVEATAGDGDPAATTSPGSSPGRQRTPGRGTTTPKPSATGRRRIRPLTLGPGRKRG